MDGIDEASDVKGIMQDLQKTAQYLARQHWGLAGRGGCSFDVPEARGSQAALTDSVLLIITKPLAARCPRMREAV